MTKALGTPLGTTSEESAKEGPPLLGCMGALKTQHWRDTVKHNPVAKYARRFNRAATHTDRKKAVRRGYRKHKQQWR